MQAQAPQPSQPAYPAHLRAQPVEPGWAGALAEDVPAGGAAGSASAGMEVLLQEAQARLLAASIEATDLGAGAHRNGKAHASSAAGEPPPQLAEQQPAAPPEASKALTGAADRQLTFKGIVFDLETTGQQLLNIMVLLLLCSL